MSEASEHPDKPQLDKPRQARKRGELSPIQRALGLLTRREHSQRELTSKLVTRGVDPDEAAAVVNKLREAGWQDDVRFAESLLRTRSGGGYGPTRLRAELQTHGLDAELVSAVIEAYDGDWTQNARGLVQRRFGADLASDLKRQRKAADMLCRRGFNSDQIRAAIRFDPEDQFGSM